MLRFDYHFLTHTRVFLTFNFEMRISHIYSPNFRFSHIIELIVQKLCLAYRDFLHISRRKNALRRQADRGPKFFLK